MQSGLMVISIKLPNMTSRKYHENGILPWLSLLLYFVRFCKQASNVDVFVTKQPFQTCTLMNKHNHVNNLTNTMSIASR